MMICLSQQRFVKILVAAICVAVPSIGVAQEVGRASAVNPAATTNMRTVVIGETITSRQRIKTESTGSVQLLFIDKTSMTIGPNSDLAIDEYVFDPRANTGKLAATLSKGALRFVGGQVSHNGDAEIKTASAVIGIRGGVALINGANVYAGYGSTTVTTAGGSVTLRAGEFTQTQGGGTPPTPPSPPPAGFVAAQVQVFQSGGGQTGGAPAGSVTTTTVSAAETRVTGSTTATVAQVAPVVNGTVQVATSTPTSNPVTSTTQQAAVVTTVQQAAQTSSQSTASVQTAQVLIAQNNTTPRPTTPVVTQPVTPVPVPVQYAASSFALTTSNCCGAGNSTSSVPYLPANYATGTNSVVSPLVGYRTASTGTANPAHFFQYGINITGLGAAQSSWGFLNGGAFISDSNGGIVETAGVSALRRGAATSGVGVLQSPTASAPGAVIVGADGLPTSASIGLYYIAPETRQYVAATDSLNLGDGTPTSTYNFNMTQTQTAASNGLGVNRPSGIFAGYTGGLMRTFNSTTNQYTGASFQTTGQATLNLDAVGNRVQANFGIGNMNVATGDVFSTGNYQFGSITLPRAKGAYVDYDNFGARGAQTAPDPTSPTEVPVSTVNGQQLNNQAGFFVNIPRSVGQQLSAGLSANTLNFCQCDLTRWGFWSSSDNRTAANGDSLFDQANLMTWVTGTQSNFSDIPTTGVATYGGHVVASIKNGNNEYVAAGNLINTVNFATRSGTATVSGLDGSFYTGTVTLPANGNQISASLTSQTRSLVLGGAFYQSTTSRSGEMAGTALLSGTNYIGSGIFAASTTGVVIPTTYAPTAFTMDMTNCCDATQASAAPYLPAGFFPATGTSVVSKVLGYRVGSQDNPAFAATMQYGINITGQGAAQTSALFVATGGFSSDGAGGFVSSNGFFASRRGAANASMGRASGTFSSPAGTVVVDATSKLPTSASITNDYYVNESRTYVANPAFAFNGGGAASQNYTFRQTATASSATPAGLGASRPEVNLTGYSGGLMRTLNTDNSTFIAPSFTTTGTATVALNPNSGRVQANFNVTNVTPNSADTFSTGNFQFGSTNTSQRSESTYVDYDTFAARRQIAVTNTQTGDTDPVSTVNGQTLTNHNGAMLNVSRSTANTLANSVGTNVTFCQCDYTRWGFWSNDSQRVSGGANVADRGNFLSWVAGRATTIAEVPTTGTATYDGHVIASIKNGNNEYIAAGSLTNTVNFGARTGIVTVNGLDSTNYSGMVAVSSSDARTFSAGLTSSTGGRSLSLNGQFFRGVASPVGEMGGSATLSGTNYIGGGTFAAKMR